MNELDRLRERDDVDHRETTVEVEAEEFETVRDLDEAGIDTSVGAVVRDAEDRIALVRNYWSDGWVIPGGKVASDENLRDAAVREVREETGLDVTVERPLEVLEHEHVHGDESVRGYFAVFETRAEGSELGDAAELGEFDSEIEAVEWFHEIPKESENADLLNRYL